MIMYLTYTRKLFYFRNQPKHKWDFNIAYDTAERALEKKWRKYFGGNYICPCYCIEVHHLSLKSIIILILQVTGVSIHEIFQHLNQELLFLFAIGCRHNSINVTGSISLLSGAATYCQIVSVIFSYV